MNDVIKFKIGMAGTLLVLLMPTMAWASVFRTNHEYTNISKDEVINDDVYVTGGNVTVSGTINGELFVAGGQVRVDGVVKDSINVTGGQVTISGSTGRSLRAGGGNVMVEGNVGHDLLVAGGSVDVAPSAKVSGDAWLTGGSVTVAGEMKSLHVSTGQLNIASTARINGPVIYQGKEDANIEKGADIKGAVSHVAMPVRTESSSNSAKQILSFGLFMKLLSTIIAALLFAYFLPHKADILAQDWRSHFGRSLLWGALALIVTPVIVVMLMVTIVGFSLGLALLAVYLLALFLGGLVGVISVGTWIQRRWYPESYPNWAAVVIGAVVLIVLQLIPILGWIVNSLVFMAGLGALVHYNWQFLSRLREEKKI